MSEVWKQIPGAMPGYEASSEGRIRSPKGVTLKCAAHHAGYRLITLRRDDKTRWQSTVHSFVALAFHGPRPDGMEVAHGDHDKTNNRPSNLRYATRRENMNDGHPRKSQVWHPWEKIEVGASFLTKMSWKTVQPIAERAGRRLNRAFRIDHIVSTRKQCRVTRVPMLDAMTCSATAEIGGAQ